LGEGGFGTAFKAEVLTEGVGGDPVCVKVTTDSNSWHGEAFLGNFLQGSTRAVQILDSFPFILETGLKRKRRRMLFATVSELMTLGTVADWSAGGDRWSEKRVKREVRLLLETLDHLHINGTSHRDITPYNVFLGPRSILKLGDFGIAAMSKLYRGARADAYNPAFKPPNVNSFWTPADDIYQVGLLAMTLLSGDVVFAGMRKTDVHQLTRTDRSLSEALKTAIDSNRAQRFQSAHDMALAMK
jgi:serine/threonine protein kinase